MAYYWYQSDPQLYQMEVAAMKKFFPTFTIHQLQDGSGRLYWRGKVQPTGKVQLRIVNRKKQKS